MKREDLEWNLGYLLDDAARLMRRAFDARIRHLGLTRAQWFVLAQLYREDGYTQTNLAKLADMDRATLGKVVDRLQEKGLIERRPHPEDRRIGWSRQCVQNQYDSTPTPCAGLVSSSASNLPLC